MTTWEALFGKYDGDFIIGFDEVQFDCKFNDIMMMKMIIYIDMFSSFSLISVTGNVYDIGSL